MYIDMKLVASIYIKKNKTVGIKSGDFRTLKVYDHSPIDTLKRFEDIGVKEIFMVDLDSALDVVLHISHRAVSRNLLEVTDCATGHDMVSTRFFK